MKWKRKLVEEVTILIAESICSICTQKRVRYKKDFTWDTLEQDFMIKKTEIDKIMQENVPEEGLTNLNLNEFVEKCTSEGIKLVYSLVLSNMAAKGIVDCFWDDQENEMKFSLNPKFKKIAENHNSYEEFIKNINHEISQGKDAAAIIAKYLNNENL